MIVVVGQPLFRATDQGGLAEGLGARVALAAARAGRSVQLVGRTGDDPEGDAVLLDLARGGVGHVAVLRVAGLATPCLTESIDADLSGPAGDADRAATALDTAVPVDAGPTLDAADVDLALRYLTDFSVLVLAVRGDEAIARVVAAAAGWADARLIVVLAASAAIPDNLPADAIVFEAPDADPDGVFADMVGAFAAALDNGDDPAVAFRSTVEAEGWTPSLDAP